MTIFRVLVVLLLAIPASGALAKRAAPTCTGGRFLSKAPLVGGNSTLVGSLMTFAPTTNGQAAITIPSCAAATGKLFNHGKKQTLLAAKWDACTGFTGKVRLNGKILNPECTQFKGKLVQTKGKPKKRTVAAELSRCGDSILDPGNHEQCDGGRGCDQSCRVDSGSSGAFGIITVNGVQKMYLPLDVPNANGHGVVAVVDVGVAGNGLAGAPALITDIDLGSSDIASATGGNADVVIVTSLSSHTVWFIDPKTDTLTGSLELPASDGASSFSGGGGVVTGVAVDSAGGRAILSVWNGFAIVDLASKTISSRIVAPPAENFGFDVKTQRILAPFYDCDSSYDGTGNPLSICGNYKTPSNAVIYDGLNIIDLTDGTTYTYQNGGSDTPVGDEPDHAAADPDLSLAVVAGEGGEIRVVDLSQGAFDKATTSVTAPQKGTSPSLVGRLTGVAIEPGSHYAFFEQEFDSGVGVLKLDGFLAGTASLVEANMPALPDGRDWGNIGDPHGIAVTTGVADGHAVGFVVEQERGWVARVDLAAFEGAGNGNVSGAIVFLDTRTPR